MGFKSIVYYLAPDGKGFQEFKIWFKSCKLLEPIYNNLETYCNELEKTKWLDINIRGKIFENIKNLLLEYITSLCGEKPLKYFNNFITELDNYCFQGGYGYIINYYTGIEYHPLPHHWRIRPEYYDKVKEIPELIQLCIVIVDVYIWIDTKPTTAYWST